jgi:hypothetical protein
MAGDLSMVDLGTSGADLSTDDLAPGDLAQSGSDGGADGNVSPHLTLNSQQWELDNDRGENPTWPPIIDLTALDPVQASVAAMGFNGDAGTACTCNAQHAQFALPATFDCSTATIEFDYTTAAGAGGFGATNTTSLLFRFANSGAGAGFLSVSEQTGASGCAISILPTMHFPSPALLHEGHNSFPLSALTAASDGSCTGTFDRLDISLEAFACSSADTSTATISNVWVF